MRHRTYRAEAPRCVCATGSDAHPNHAKPGNVVGKHFDPRCPHSELYNCVVKFPQMHAEQRKQNAFPVAMRRITLV